MTKITDLNCLVKCSTVYIGLVAAVSFTWSSIAHANTCPSPRQTWFVEAGAPDGGDGGLNSPLNSTQQINDCTGIGDKIFVVPSTLALEGELILKAHQSLMRLGNNKQGKTARLGVKSGAGLQLADHVLVKDIIVEENGSPVAPVATALIDGQLSEGGVRLKGVSVLKNEAFNGAGAINLNIDASNAINPISLDGVDIQTEIDPASVNVNNWFKVGVRVSVASVTGACASQELDLRLKNINVENSSNSVGVFQFCQSDTRINLQANDVNVTNGVGDHFVLINQGEIDTQINQYHSFNSPSARDAINQSSFSPAFNAGVNFGLEYFGFPTAGPSRLKVRNSSISRSTGNGVGILQFAKANPTDLILDFGCTDFDCADRGLDSSPGNNAIFDNVAGSGDPIGNDYETYLVSPFGLALIFPFPLMVNADVANNIGSSQNLFIDAPSDVEFVAQGNFWGGTNPSLGECAELGVNFGPGGAFLAQTNSSTFSPTNQWNCSLWNTFTLGDFPQQPDTSDALSYNPH